MTDTTTPKPHQLMTEMKQAMAEALFNFAQDNGGNRVPDASFVGATAWLLCELLIATDKEFDDTVISALKRTYELAKPQADIARSGSVH